MAGERVGEGVLTGAEKVAGDEVGEGVLLGTTAAARGRPEGAARVAATWLLRTETLTGPVDASVCVLDTPNDGGAMLPRTGLPAAETLAVRAGDREE